VTMLEYFANMLPDYGFTDIITVFQSWVPLVKCTDIHSGTEVDFCMGNALGLRNSQLLDTYCRYDKRAAQLGRLVKDWAKSHELVGSADGCLNSYAYILLVVHYLQSVQPPVLPNLQKLALGSFPVIDRKWGCSDCWETRFLDDISELAPSQNTESIVQLFVGFLSFFSQTFDWSNHAVCIRLNEPGGVIDKFSLSCPTSQEQWYLEDPFDLKHNLAGKCTHLGRERILDEMQQALGRLAEEQCSLERVCPSEKPERFFLKCRVAKAVTLSELVGVFDGFEIEAVHYPEQGGRGRPLPVFLEFASAAARRRAHTQNEAHAGGCQLQLLSSSKFALAEAMLEGTKYTAYTVSAGQA